MGIWYPCVHREYTYLRREPDKRDQESNLEKLDIKIRNIKRWGECCKVDKSIAPITCVEKRQDTEKTNRNPRPTDDEILPRGFPVAVLTIEANQKHRRDRRRLDTDPHDDEIAGHRDEEDRSDKEIYVDQILPKFLEIDCTVFAVSTKILYGVEINDRGRDDDKQVKHAGEIIEIHRRIAKLGIARKNHDRRYDHEKRENRVYFRGCIDPPFVDEGISRSPEEGDRDRQNSKQGDSVHRYDE